MCVLRLRVYWGLILLGSHPYRTEKSKQWRQSHDMCVHVCDCLLLPQGYGSTFIKQYVVDSGAGGDMNVGEFWADLHWEDGGGQHWTLGLMCVLEG